MSIKMKQIYIRIIVDFYDKSFFLDINILLVMQNIDYECKLRILYSEN